MSTEKTSEEQVYEACEKFVRAFDASEETGRGLTEALKELRAALTTVLEGHTPTRKFVRGHWWCMECDTYAPCDTFIALLPGGEA